MANLTTSLGPLVKLLAAELTPMGGKRVTAKDLNVGYFAQHQIEQLNSSQSALQHLQALDSKATERELRGHLGGCSHAGPAAPPGLTHRCEVPQHVQAVHGELEERGEGVEEAEADEPSAVVRGSGGDDARVEQGESRGALEGIGSVGADLCARRPER